MKFLLSEEQEFYGLGDWLDKLQELGFIFTEVNGISTDFHVTENPSIEYNSLEELLDGIMELEKCFQCAIAIGQCSSKDMADIKWAIHIKNSTW